MKLLFLFLALSVAINAFAGTDTHGGGGVVRNGNYLTVGSASLIVEPASIDMPEVEFVVDKLLELNLDKTVASKLVTAVTNLGERQYFNISKLDSAEEQRLVDVYKSQFNLQSADAVVIYAITDSAKNETYLLPSFYKLPDLAARSSIIFHESLWVVKRELLTYNEVIRLEVAFERYIRCTNNCSAQKDALVYLIYEAFSKTYTSNMWGHRAIETDQNIQLQYLFTYLSNAYISDINANIFPSWVESDNSIRLENMIGTQAVEELAADLAVEIKDLIYKSYFTSGIRSISLRLNVDTIKLALALSKQEYPKSSLLRTLSLVAQFNLNFKFAVSFESSRLLSLNSLIDKLTIELKYTKVAMQLQPLNDNQMRAKYAGYYTEQNPLVGSYGYRLLFDPPTAPPVSSNKKSTKIRNEIYKSRLIVDGLFIN